MTVWSTEMHGRIRTGPAPSRRPPPAAPPRRTTRCANCPRCQLRRRCRRPSRASPSCGRATPACPHPPSWPCMPPPGDAPLSPRRTTNALDTTIAYSFKSS